MAEQTVGTQVPERLDRYPAEGLAGRLTDRQAELAALVQAATDAAMGHQAEQARLILAAAEREAPERARQGQGGGTDGGIGS